MISPSLILAVLTAADGDPVTIESLARALSTTVAHTPADLLPDLLSLHSRKEVKILIQFQPSVQVAIFEDPEDRRALYFRLISNSPTVWSIVQRRGDWAWEASAFPFERIPLDRLRPVPHPVRMAEIAQDAQTLRTIQGAISDYLGDQAWQYAEDPRACPVCCYSRAHDSTCPGWTGEVAPLQTPAALIPQINSLLGVDYLTRETLAADLRYNGINFRDEDLAAALREMIDGGDVDEDGDFVRNALAARLAEDRIQDQLSDERQEGGE